MPNTDHTGDSPPAEPIEVGLERELGLVANPDAEPIEVGLERELPTTVIMAVADWIEVPGNPHQRDTERHLIRAKHLLTPSPAHLQVNAAQLPDGSMVKLDGHTRALLWMQEPERAPDGVLCALYPVNTMAEAEVLYHHFDNRAAADTSADDLSGAFNAAGFVPESPLLRAYRCTYALKRATAFMLGMKQASGLDVYKIVPRWLSELREIDNLNATVQRFSNNAILTAALLTIRRRGAKAVEAWDRFQRDAGIKTETTLDGIESLGRLRAADLTSKNFDRITGKAISCMEYACDGQMLRLKEVVGISPTRYCAGMKRERAAFADLIEGFRSRVAEQSRLKYELKKHIKRAAADRQRLH